MKVLCSLLIWISSLIMYSQIESFLFPLESPVNVFMKKNQAELFVNKYSAEEIRIRVLDNGFFDFYQFVDSGRVVTRFANLIEEEENYGASISRRNYYGEDGGFTYSIANLPDREKKNISYCDGVKSEIDSNGIEIFDSSFVEDKNVLRSQSFAIVYDEHGIITEFKDKRTKDRYLFSYNDGNCDSINVFDSLKTLVKTISFNYEYLSIEEFNSYRKLVVNLSTDVLITKCFVVVNKFVIDNSGEKFRYVENTYTFRVRFKPMGYDFFFDSLSKKELRKCLRNLEK